jgi:hypothetical protein
MKYISIIMYYFCGGIGCKAVRLGLLSREQLLVTHRTSGPEFSAEVTVEETIYPARGKNLPLIDPGAVTYYARLTAGSQPITAERTGFSAFRSPSLPTSHRLREGGVWHYYIGGLSQSPTSNPSRPRTHAHTHTHNIARSTVCMCTLTLLHTLTHASTRTHSH